MYNGFAKSVDRVQCPLSTHTDLGQHCLPMVNFLCIKGPVSLVLQSLLDWLRVFSPFSIMFSEGFFFLSVVRFSSIFCFLLNASTLCMAMKTSDCFAKGWNIVQKAENAGKSNKIQKRPFENINPFPNKPWFLRVCSTSLLKTLWEKEKLLVTSNFSFSHSVFYPFVELSTILITFEIVVCKLFEFGLV